MAVYDSEPYAHMIPIQTIISGIRTAFHDDSTKSNVHISFSHCRLKPNSSWTELHEGIEVLRPAQTPRVEDAEKEERTVDEEEENVESQPTNQHRDTKLERFAKRWFFAVLCLMMVSEGLVSARNSVLCNFRLSKAHQQLRMSPLFPF